MTQSTVIGLLNNAALLLALALLYDTLFTKSPDKAPANGRFFGGLIIGSIGIVIMMTPWEFAPGVVFDTRSVLLSISGFFFGPVPTMTAVLITGGYRFYLGGSGMWMGIAVIITSGGLGVLWRHFREPDFKNISVMEFYAFGIVVHVTMLLCTVFLPWSAVRQVLFNIGIPVMIIYPIGTALLGQLILNRHNRKQAEIELIQVKSFTENALNAQIDTFFVLDPESRKAIWWNRAFNRVSGYTDDEIAGMKAPDAYFSDEEMKKADAGIQEMYQKGKATVEVSLTTKSGTSIPTEYSISPITSNNQTQYIITIGRDITERKKSESELRESEARFRAITSTAVDPIFCKDGARRYTFVNQAMAKLVGYQEQDLIGKTPEEIFDADSAAIIKEIDDRALNGERVNEIRSIRIGSRDFVFNTIQVPIEIIDGKVVSISGIVRDITDIIIAQNEKLKLELQLRQSQKLESIGILSGGIAHDFNNLLYVISGNTELLLEDARADDQEPLNYILSAAQRGADLVRQLLTFSRKSEINLQPVSLNDEIRRIYKMLERVFPKMIEIKLDLADDLPSVDADPGQIEQVLMNLSLNARDAIPDRGTLLIRTEYGKTRNYGPAVILKVSDTGHGIGSEDLESIFDPFFTTKEIGKGSGLGLSVIYGIIKAHNGEIFCESKPGAGTTFTIYLPAAKGHQVNNLEEPKASDIFRGSETILIVDDDASILTLTRTILAHLGYQTLLATSGESALDVYAEKHDEIDLIILDLGMPGMGGKKCLEELIHLNPAVKVIIASGYSEDGPVRDVLNHGAMASVVKPYTIEKFSEVIRSVLETEPN